MLLFYKTLSCSFHISGFSFSTNMAVYLDKCKTDRRSATAILFNRKVMDSEICCSQLAVFNLYLPKSEVGSMSLRSHAEDLWPWKAMTPRNLQPFLSHMNTHKSRCALYTHHVIHVLYNNVNRVFSVHIPNIVYYLLLHKLYIHTLSHILARIKHRIMPQRMILLHTHTHFIKLFFRSFDEYELFL